MAAALALVFAPTSTSYGVQASSSPARGVAPKNRRSMASTFGVGRRAPPSTASALPMSSSGSPFDNNDPNHDELLLPPTHHRIAVVVSTHRNGGQATAYSFANAAAAEKEDNDKQRGLRRRNKRKDIKRPTTVSSTSLIGSVIKSTFLPTGYPDQIPSGYLNYVVHSVLQDLSTQLRSVLATQRILRGVGVGQPHATALSALLQFLLRDGCGMAGSLIFTSVFASQFRNDVKRWRLLADLVLDVGMTLEVAALSVPSKYFVPMICAGNVCKAICGVAAGATGGAIALHWASNPRQRGTTVLGPSSDHDDDVDPNLMASSSSPATSRSGTGSDISDIQAKFAAQNTVTGSLGLVAAAWFAKSVSDLDSTRLWGWYAILTFLHLYGNAKCMRLIHFNYLNTERLGRVANDFFAKFTPSLGPSTSTASSSSPASTTMPWSTGGTSSMLFLPNPNQVAEEEPLWFLSPSQLLMSNARRGLAIRYGVRFDKFVQASRWTEDDLMAAMAVDDSYVVAIEKVGSSHRKKPRNVVVAIMETASTLQRTKAYFHALLLKRRVGELMSTATNNNSSNKSDVVDHRLRQIERIVQREMDEGHTWKLFCKECYRSGWDLKRSELRTEGYEVAIQYRRT